MRIITLKDAERLKDNSVKLAKRTGRYDAALLDEARENIEVMIRDGFPPRQLWYGMCGIDDNGIYPSINVYSKNMSSQKDNNIIRDSLALAGIPDYMIKEICWKVKDIPEKKFFNMFNQTGMDHELIGHGYYWLKKGFFDEKAAIDIQIDLANERAKKDNTWKGLISMMSAALYHTNLRQG